jgi:cytoskeletal protein CcmA (bactofilin family)
MRTTADSEHSMIGKSTRFKGEIVASEPLYILGTVEGTIISPTNRVTVEKEGKVNADISAREILIMGEVCGNLDGADRVEIRKGGSLTGNLAAHRICIEEGALLTGMIDVRRPVEKDNPAQHEKPRLVSDREAAIAPAELSLAGD